MIASKILKTLNIKQEEEKKFIALFFHSFFLGLFIALYFLAANAAFIRHFDSKNLPVAYIAAGVVGYFLSLVYSFLQRHVHSRTLFLSSLFFMSAIPILSRFLVEFVDQKWMSFFVFIWAWPFISLVSTETGGLALQKLNLRQVKRLFSLINAGGVLASIFAYLSVPLLLRLFNSSFDILCLASIGSIVSIIILLKIYKLFPDKAAPERSGERNELYSFRLILKDKYLSLIFLTAFFSIISIYLIDFGFLSAVKVHQSDFPTSESVSNFLALVYSGLKIIEFITSLYSGRWLARYGIKFGLAALPVSLFLLMVAAVLSGFSWGTESMLMFVLLVVSKVAERFIRRSLEDPAFNVLYQPLPNDQQLAVQTRVGIVIQFSVGIAGIILVLINSILTRNGVFRLEYFPLVLIPIVGCWLWVAFRLYTQYRSTLRHVLIEKGKEVTRTNYRYKYGDEILRRKLKPFSKYSTRLATIILSESNPRQLQRYVVPLLNENDPIVTPSVLRSITPFFQQKAIRSINTLLEGEYGEDMNTDLAWVRKCLQRDDFEPTTPEEADLLWLKQQDFDSSPATIARLSSLIDTPNLRIQHIAIERAVLVDSKQLRRKIVGLLTNSNLRNFVADIITENSPDVVDELKVVFYNSTSKTVLNKIIEVLAKIGTLQARKLLLQQLNYPDRELQIAVIHGLHFCRFEADETNTELIVAKIREVISNILRISVCIKEIDDKSNTLKLQQSLELDNNENLELLFNLLSFLYTPTTIELVRKNIIGENVIFALEIIENFMSAEIKRLIVPLFESNSISQKLKRLEYLVTIPKLKFADRLKEIVVSDFSVFNDWTRAKAIEQIGRLHKQKISAEQTDSPEEDSNEIEIWTAQKVGQVLNKIRKSEMPDEIFLSLYHANELVYSTSARIIYDENPSRCLNYIKTLKPSKQFLATVFTGNNAEMLLTERLKYIKRHLLFFNIPEKKLVKIAKVLHPLRLRVGDEINLNSQAYRDKIFVILNGELKSVDDAHTKIFRKNDVVIKGINLPESSAKMVVTKKSFLFFGVRSSYFNLLLDDTEIIHHMFENL